MKKNKAHLFEFFSLLCPLCIFFHFNLKIHAKKDKNVKKRQKIFSNSKNIFKKKVENIISKNHAKKKAEMQKVGCVYYAT